MVWNGLVGLAWLDWSGLTCSSVVGLTWSAWSGFVECGLVWLVWSLSGLVGLVGLVWSLSDLVARELQRETATSRCSDRPLPSLRSQKSVVSSLRVRNLLGSI